jgi:hypothetical protein
MSLAGMSVLATTSAETSNHERKHASVSNDTLASVFCEAR